MERESVKIGRETKMKLERERLRRLEKGDKVTITSLIDEAVEKVYKVK